MTFFLILRDSLHPSDSPEMGLHVVYLTETKPPEQCSAQDLIDELVRRALQKRDKSEVADEVAGSWFPIEKE